MRFIARYKYNQSLAKNAKHRHTKNEFNKKAKVMKVSKEERRKYRTWIQRDVTFCGHL